MIATFLNPLGFDLIVYKLNQLTKDYWNTMFILYGLAFLSFLLSYFFFKLKKINLGNFLMTIGLFLNPLGYDIVVYFITLFTKSYWFTMVIMYLLAFLFFGLFMFLYEINPIKYIKEKIIGKFKNKKKYENF